MKHNDEFIANIETILPNQCKVSDLIKTGIYTNSQTASQARKRGVGPAFFKVGGRVFYVKGAVIEWMKNNSYGAQDSNETA